MCYILLMIMFIDAGSVTMIPFSFHPSSVLLLGGTNTGDVTVADCGKGTCDGESRGGAALVLEDEDVPDGGNDILDGDSMPLSP